MADDNYLPVDLTAGNAPPTKLDSIEQATNTKVNQLQQKQELRNQQAVDLLMNRDRTTGEIVSDTAASVVLKGGNALGQIGYGVLDALSRKLPGMGEQPDYTPGGGFTVRDRGSLESLTGAASSFGEIRNLIDDNLMSDPLRAAQKRVAEKGQIRKSGKSDRVNKLLEDGYSKLSGQVIDEAGSLVDTVKNYASDPIAAVDVALESIPQMLVGGALGKGLSAGKAGQVALANTAVSEGSSNAVDAMASVSKMSHEQLTKDSPLYNELLKTMSPEDAKTSVERKVFDTTAALSGTVGLATGKLTSKFEGNLFNKGSDLGSIITGTAKNTVTEAVEETLQGAGGQISSNIAKQAANKNQEISEDVGASAGAGLVAGGLSGGAISAASQTAKKALTTGAKVADKVTKPIKETSAVNEAIKTKDTSKLESDADLFEAKVALLPTEPEARKASIAELNTHANAAQAQAIKDLKEADPEKNRAAQIAAVHKAKELKNIAKGLSDKDTDPKAVQASIDNLLKSKEPKKEEVNNVLGSMATVPTEKLTELADSDVTSTEQSKAIKAHIDTRQAIERVESLTTGSVNSDVIDGGDGKIGLKEYQSDINIAITGNDKDTAKTKLKEFGAFAKSHITKAGAVYNAYKAIKSKSANASELVQAVKDEYGLEIHKNSDSIKGGQLISTLSSEAQALQAAYKESVAIASNQFGNAPKVAPIINKNIPEVNNEEQVTIPESTQKITPVPDAPEATARTIERTRAIEPIVTETLLSVGSPQEQVKLTSDLVKLPKDKAKLYMKEVNRGISDAQSGIVLVDKQNGAYDRGVKLAGDTTNKYSISESVSNTSTDGSSFVKDNFTRRSTDENQRNILATTPDAMSNIRSVRSLTPKQSLTLDHVQEFDAYTQKTFKEIFKPKNSKFLKEDSIGFLANEDGSFDSNVVSSIGVAAYSWAASRAATTLFNDLGAINSILGNRADKALDYTGWELLARAGSVRATVAEGIGADILKTLDIKATREAEGNTQANMEMSVGQMAVTILLDAGVLEETDIPNSELDAYRENESGNSNATTSFVRITTDSEGNISNTVQSFMENVRDSDNLLEEVFGQDNKVTTPLFEAPTTSPTTVKGSKQKVSDEANRIVAKHQKRPNKLFLDKMNVFNSLSDLGKEIAAGVVQDVETNVHETLREQTIAKNNSLLKDINVLTEFEATSEDKPFYFKHEIWKNGRIGMVSNTINPQSSKIHRHLLGPSDWEIQVDPNDKPLMDNFYSAVGLGMGISVDKQDITTTVAEVKELMTNETIVAGIEAIRAIQKDEATEQSEQQLLAAIKEGGEKIHSLEALTAYAAFVEANGEPFTTSLTPEVDGITNGIMIGSIQFAATDPNIKNTLGRGGMYFDDLTESYATKKKEVGFMDSYEDMANDWIDNIKLSPELQNLDNRTRNALKRIVGSFQVVAKDGSVKVSKAGRNKAKPVLMTNVYGASVNNVVKAFNESVTEKLYEDLGRNRNDSVALQGLADTLNQLLGSDYKITPENALTFQVDKQHVEDIQQLVADTYGKALETTINTKFAVFIKNRTDTNTALQVIFEGFKIRFDRMVAEQSKDGRELSRNDIDAIVSELTESLPIVKHALSQGQHDGLLVMGEEKVRQYDDAHRVEQSYKRPIAGTKNIRKNGAPKSKSLAYTSKRNFKDGGVSGAILAIHSIDAASMLGSMDADNVLGVHDAIFAGLDKINDATVTLNKAFHKNNADYSIMGSVAESLEHSIKVLEKEDMRKGTDNIDQLNIVLSEGIFKKGDMEFAGATEYVKQYRNSANQLTQAKDQLMRDMTSNGQYFLDGSDYKPNTAQDDEQNFIETIAEEKNKSEQIVKELVDAFGSSTNAIDTNNFGGTKVDITNNMNAEQVFNQLGKLGNVTETADHSDHLGSILSNVILPVVDSFTFNLRTEGGITHGAAQGNDVYVNLGMGTLTNGTQMSAQEVYVHELVHNVTSEGVRGDSFASRELKKLFTEVEKQITPEDFLNKNTAGDVLDSTGSIVTPADANYATELEAATARYEYIFKNTTSINGRNPYLDEFMALGLTNKQFINALSKMDVTTKKDSIWAPDDLPRTFMNLFAYVMDKLTSRITHTSDLNADKKLMALATQIAGVEHRSKNVIYRNMQDFGDTVNKTIKKAVVYVAEPLVELLQNNSLVNSKYDLVKSVGSIASKTGKVKYEAFANTMTQVTRRMGFQRDNLAQSLATEIKGRTADNGKWHDLLRMSNKMIDQTRLAIQTNVKKQLNGAFSRDLSKQEKDVINKVMFKTDLSVLRDTKDWDQINKLITDTDALNNEISKYSGMLNQFTSEKFYYRKMAASLGNFMAKGQFTEHQSMMNAHNIANMFGTGFETDVDTVAAEKIIDVLATLHAIKNTDATSKKVFSDLVTEESNIDPLNNGITFTEQVHRQNKIKSLNESFSGQKALMVKGFTKEIFNPNISIIYGSKDDEKEFLREGYQIVKEVHRDVTDPISEKLFMYKSTTDSLNTHMAGVVSNTSKRAKGSDLINNRNQVGSMNPSLDAMSDSAQIANRKQLQVNNIVQDKPTATSEVMYVPMVDGQGNVKGYRYMMNEANKNEILEKSNSFDDVLGQMEAAITDKTNTKDINEQAVKVAYEEYQATYADDPQDFVLIGKGSVTEADREIYQLMPKDMRDEIKRVWGTDGMYVRKELVPLIFGQRKVSAVDSAFNNQTMRKLNETVFDMFGFSIQQKLRVGENVWQEIVKTVKDVIVIKSGSVLAGNIGSNLILLKTLGVSAKDIAKHHATAIRASTSFQRDIAELDELERELEVNPNVVGKKSKQVKIAQLKDSIDKSPVKELIDEGVYQSIVEDISLVDDKYAYKTKLQELISSKVPSKVKVPELLKTIGNNAVMSHETQLYKSLRDATQLSDFVARYTLHQHNLDKGMSSKDSINQLIDIFVNYDLPTHKSIQYANDIGLLMFTKFFIRIQKVIAHIVTKHPANTLAVMGVQGMLGDYSDIMDSNIVTNSVLDKFNLNPVSVASSALDVPIINLVD